MFIEESKPKQNKFYIKAQLEKLGNTPFISVDTKIEMDKKLTIVIKK